MLFVQRGSQVISAGDKAIVNVYLHGNKGTQRILLKKGVTLYSPDNPRKGQGEEEHRTPMDWGWSQDPVNHLLEFPHGEKTSLAIDAIPY